MKKKILLWVLVLFISITSVFAVINYSGGRYGHGIYGINTPPNVTVAPPAGAYGQDINTTVHLNVTVIDWDYEPVTIDWWSNDTFNKTGGNISINTSQPQVLNIRVNITDINNEGEEHTWTLTFNAIITEIISDSMFFIKNSIGALMFWINEHGIAYINSLEGTYTGDAGYVCVHANGTLYGSNSSCT